MTEPSSSEIVGEADREYLSYLVQSTISGLEQLNGLGRQWNASQTHASQLVSKELQELEVRRQKAESEKQCLLQDNFRKSFDDSSVLDELPPSKNRASSLQVSGEPLELDSSQNSVEYWKTKSMQLEVVFEERLKREQSLLLEVRRKSQQQQQQQHEEQRQHESLQIQLGRANNFLHFVLRNAPIALVHFDKDLRYQFVYNQYPGHGSDLLGKKIEEIYDGPNLKENVEFKKRVLAKGVADLKEYSYYRNDFGWKAFLQHLDPVVSRTGERIGLNSVYMDVSDQMGNREKLACIREEEAVRKAMESEMYKTMRISEQTIKAKELLATMSREIRSPLSGVVSMAGLLAASDLDEEQRHLVEVMVASGDLVLQLLDDILDYSRAELSGVPKLDEGKVCLRDVIKNVLLIAAASLQKNLTLKGFITKEVPVEVVGDVLKLRQVLTNLVSNAVKFTHEGLVAVSMEVVQLEGNNVVHVQCEVTDTGIGIPESVLPKLFTKYVQASETHQRKYGGTGLGLAISKELVELMGGTIRIRSKEKEGSTFSFTLPFKLCTGYAGCNMNTEFAFTPARRKFKKRPQQVVRKDEVENKCDRTRTRKEPKLLLAEDNKVNIMVAQKMLKHFGLEASVVNNGLEAVQAAKENHYDLILMDVIMPVMDGIEATRLIREFLRRDPKQQQCRTAIVAMTANAFDEDACYANGMDSFITKPVTFPSIQRVIEQFLLRS